MEETPTDPGPFRLLFVCTGNTCRSPMAEVIARHRIGELGWEQVEVSSAGVGAFEGSPASRGAVRAAAAHGLDLDEHRATLLTPELAESADLILTMGPGHLMRVVELGAGERAAIITSFARRGDERDRGVGVPDPIGGSDQVYAETFEALDGLIEGALERIAPLVEP